jgi:ribonuclease R
MLLLRSLKQATYDVVNIGHFGLASKAYLHFTSPIRRYPDLLVHRSTHAIVLGKRRSSNEEEELAEAARLSSENERRAMEIEREVVDIYRCVFMRDRIGERYEGTVTGLVGTGAYVVLDDPFVDVLVRFEDLGTGGERYEIDDDGLSAVSERSRDVIRLGDRMNVEIVDAAIVRRTVYAKRVGHVVADAEDGDRRGRGRDTRGAKGRSRRPERGAQTSADRTEGRRARPERTARADSKHGARDKTARKGKKGGRRRGR